MKCGGYGDETSAGFSQNFLWIKTQEKIPPGRKDKDGNVPAKWIAAWGVTLGVFLLNAHWSLLKKSVAL